MGDRSFDKKTGGDGASKTASTVTPEKKEAVMEFTPHVAGEHQSVTHDTVKEHTLQELQMELRHVHDTVKCLRDGVNNGTPMTKPTRKIEALGVQSAEEQKMNQDGHDMEWQTERKEFSVRKNMHKENVCKAHSMMFGHCNKTTQSRIAESSEFETKIRNDPWALMDAVKLRMCGQVRAKHE